MAIMEKRTEITPLHGRGILKLIQKEMVETDSYLLIYERSIRSVDNTLEYCVRIIYAQHILLLHNIIEGIRKFPCHSQTINLVIENTRRHIYRILLFP